MTRTYRWTEEGLRKRKAALADPAVRAKMSAASKAAWADPAVRAKMSAARKAALADPAVRAKMSAARKKGCLAPDQIEAIKEALIAGQPYVDIANDWLITTGYVSVIARRLGLRRRPRKASANSSVAERATP